mgnify:CR=1 FL=1
MSIRVLKAKSQARRLVAEKNSVALLPVNLNYSDNSPNICVNLGGVQKAPAPQKSYGNYNRQALLGYSGLANRVVSLRNSQTNAVIPTESNNGRPERNTYKRMPEFSQGQHLYNLTCGAVRCKDTQARCAPVAPRCYNNGDGDSCGKTKISITKDIGYISSGEYLKRKIARRVTNTSQPFELPQAPAGNGRLTC